MRKICMLVLSMLMVGQTAVLNTKAAEEEEKTKSNSQIACESNGGVWNSGTGTCVGIPFSTESDLDGGYDIGVDDEVDPGFTLTPELEKAMANEPIAIREIHISSQGDDNNDGLSEGSAVKSFEKAKSLINDGDTILVDGYIEVFQDETWDLSEFPNSKLQRNTAMDMIVVSPNVTLTLKNIVIDGTHYSKTDDDSHSIIKLGKLAGSEADGSKVILESGTILENNKNNRGMGGAIAGFSYDTVIMENGAIIRNNGTLDKTAQFGGGIHLENHGQFIMNGGLIENNHAVRGGGVCLIASSMVMNGGEIKNNSANSKDSYAGHYGGGIYVSNFQDWPAVGGDYSREIAGEASFTMNGGTISGNKATYQSSTGDKGLGGAIATYPAFYVGYEHNPSISININKGDIIDNAAINGGAISAYFDAVDVNISNANISNNEAESQGGAIYGVFNSNINLVNTVISQNKASIGAGVYLHSSEMKMTSGEISQNEAENYGGGIFIDKPAWNNKTAVCTILGGEIKSNTATKGEGSDGIYQNSSLRIADDVLIDADNDVYLPSGRIIDVVSSLKNIDKNHPVSITSENKIIEDESTPGTKLVKYHEAAGGTASATNAEVKQHYIASSYMPEGYIIGKSDAADQLDFMTYIPSDTYWVNYVFVSETNKNLPEEVLALLPFDDQRYSANTVVYAIQPAQLSVTVSDGTWEFVGYDAESKTIQNDSVEFIGTWRFVPNGTGGGTTPTEKYTVTYTDGVDDEVVFEDQVTGDLASGEKTPEFVGTPTRKGYTFVGWNPEVAETVTATATYTAQWKKDETGGGTVVPTPTYYKVTYTDGVEGEEVFEDQVTKGLSYGEKTPAFEGTPTRAGYRFIGWEPEVAESVKKSAVYAARWEKIEEEEQTPPPAAEEGNTGSEAETKPDSDEVKDEVPDTGVRSVRLAWTMLLLSAACMLGGFIRLRKKNQ